MAEKPEAVSTRGMKNQVRIRGPKPDVCFHAKSLDEMETLLKKHIDQCKDKPVPETVYAQFLFDNTVTFQIKDTSDGIRDHFAHMQDPQYNTGPVPLPVTEAVAQVPDTKLKLRRQRAVGRAILGRISAVDELSYTEKEAWDTKHADGYRFKYLCRDSYQNRDRAANKSRKSTDPASFTPVNNGNGTPTASAAGTPTAQPPPLAAGGVDAAIANANANADDQSPTKGADVSRWFEKHGLTPPAAESPARMPTYDCKGSIFVKFSSSQGVVDVVYQHLPIHNSTNERAPDPLPEKGSRASLPAGVSNGTPHDDSGDPMDTSEMPSYHATPQAGTPIATPSLPEQAAAAAAANKPVKSTETAPKTGVKRKRNSTKPAPVPVAEEDLSDLSPLEDEFDDQVVENLPPPPPLVDPGWEPDPGDADLWRPSVVTLVPGLKTMTKTTKGKGGWGGARPHPNSAAAKARKEREEREEAMEVDESSASGSDFEGGPSTAKGKGKKKAAPKAKAKASAATSGAEKNGGSGAGTGGSKATSKSITKSEAQISATGTGIQSDKEGVSDRTKTRPRTRTKTGCWTCRGRKLKCDEVRPSCSQCRRSRPPRECTWPDEEGEGDEDDLSDSLVA